MYAFKNMTIGKAILVALIAINLGLVPASSPKAATNTGTLTVQATVQSLCIFDSISYTMDFGNYSGVLDVASTITTAITCNDQAVAWEILGSFGTN